MCRALCLLCTCICFPAVSSGDEYVFPDGTPAQYAKGIVLFRRGNQTTTSIGGVLFPQKVKVVTANPDGPAVTRFTLPSALHSPTNRPFPPAAAAALQVQLPDPIGLLYLNGELLPSEGLLRHLLSPPLPQGSALPVQLRAAFRVGDRLLIEDKQLLLRPGEATTVIFVGKQAFSVTLPERVPPATPSAR